jgi:biopolymer transport protein ExbD
VFESRRDKTLYVIGAPDLRYKEIVRIIDAAHGAGVRRVGIVTEAMRTGSRVRGS